jgi:hypothetical protein
MELREMLRSQESLKNVSDMRNLMQEVEMSRRAKQLENVNLVEFTRTLLYEIGSRLNPMDATSGIVEAVSLIAESMEIEGHD